MNEPLRLSLLGTPRILWHDQPLTGFARNKTQALLFYLAVTAAAGRPPHSRDAILTLLWSEMTDAQARQNLRATLPVLRRLLGDYIMVDRQTVAFAPTGSYWLDVDVLRRTLTPGGSPTRPEGSQPADLAARQAAVDLYQGEFLHGLYVRDAPAFEAWVLEERELIHTLVANALTALVGEYIQTGDDAAALTANRRLLMLEPWSEPTHRQQMLLLAQMGERAAALAQYEACRHALAAEFGIEPLPETTVLYEQIRAGGGVRSPESVVLSHESVVLSPQTAVNRQGSQDSSQDEQSDAELRTGEPGLWTQVAGHNLPLRTKLYGRQAELASLHKWVVEDGCFLVGIFGIGGQGKTVLAATLVRELAEAAPPSHAGGVGFTRILWQSLLNAPPLSEVLQEWVYVLSDQTVTTLPTSLDQQFAQLLDYLRRHRCLLILDNLESILQHEERSGYYRPGYEAYGQLLGRLAAGGHRSCLLLTSRERPQDLTHLAEDAPHVRFLALTGLSADAGRQKLLARGVIGDPANLAALVQQYAGNPLALKLVAETIQSVFAGNITAFLQAETLIFDDIRDVLDQQFARLTPLERELILWLAVVREPLPFPLLRELLAQPPTPRLVLEAVRSLQRRSLLETFDDGFGLQNVVLEYTTELLIEEIVRELLDDKVTRWQGDMTIAAPDHPVIQSSSHPIILSHFNRYALVLAQVKEYVRASQTRLLLQPVAERLLRRLGRAGAVQRLQSVLSALREHAPRTPGYAAANLLHLLLQVGVNLQEYDFAQLSLRQIYLRGVELPQVNFAQADLTGALFTEPLGRINAVAFSPDGRWLAAGTREGAIHLWRTADQQLVQVIQAHNHVISALTFAQPSVMDARAHPVLASVSEDQTVGLWQLTEDAVARQYSQRLEGHQQAVTGVGFNADEQRLMSVDVDGNVQVWELSAVRRGQRAYQFKCQPGFRGLAFSRDGQTLAIGSREGQVYLWQLSGVPGLVLSGHARDIGALAFSPDGRLLASADMGGRICLFALPQGQRLQAWDTIPGFTGALAFAPDGRTLASSHWDRTIRLWRVDVQQETPDALPVHSHPIHTLIGHTHVIWSLAFHPDGHMLASGASDQTVRVWDTQTGRPLYTLRGHSHALNALALSPDGARLVAVGYDHLVHLWQGSDLAVGAMHRALHGHKGILHTVAFSPDGRTLASAGRDPVIQLWDAASGQLRRTLHGHTPDIYRIAFHPDGQLLASGSADGTIWLWDLCAPERGKPAGIIQANREIVYTLAFSPDGRILASTGVGTAIRLWDMTQAGWPELVEARKILQEPGEHEGLALAFSPDGAKLACSGTRLIHLWDLPSGEPPLILRHHIDWVMSVAFNPDGTLLASASEDRTIALWDVAQSTLQSVLSGHSEGVYSAVFSPDGGYLVSASADGTIKFWDVQGGECLNTLTVEGPYAGMKISGVTGITEAQKAALRALGAVEAERVNA